MTNTGLLNDVLHRVTLSSATLPRVGFHREEKEAEDGEETWSLWAWQIAGEVPRVTTTAFQERLLSLVSLISSFH